MKKRNFKSRLISAISAVICAITFCAGSVNVDMFNKVEAASSSSRLTYGGLYYANVDSDHDGEYDYIVITGYNKSLYEYTTERDITIPSEINGKPVKSISSSDFDGINQNHTKGVHISLTIPDSVISIYGIEAPSPLNTRMGCGIRFYCYENSYAHQYAVDENIDFTLLKRPVVTTPVTTTTKPVTTTTITTMIKPVTTTTITTMIKPVTTKATTTMTKPITTTTTTTTTNPVTTTTTTAKPVTTTRVTTTTKPVTTAITTTATKPITTVKSGDLNGDGNTTAADIVFLQKFLVNAAKLTDTQWELADINNDGKINVFDVIILKRRMLYN